MVECNTTRKLYWPLAQTAVAKHGVRGATNSHGPTACPHRWSEWRAAPGGTASYQPLAIPIPRTPCATTVAPQRAQSLLIVYSN